MSTRDYSSRTCPLEGHCRGNGSSLEFLHAFQSTNSLNHCFSTSRLAYVTVIIMHVRSIKFYIYPPVLNGKVIPVHYVTPGGKI